jgi:hypothetical protein
MKFFSIVMMCLLTSCNTFYAHKDDLKPIAHDMTDEAIDDAAAYMHEDEKKIDSTSTQ